FANLLKVLADQAAMQHNALTSPTGEDIPRYLLNNKGEFLCDPTVEEQRAAVLLGHLEQSARQRSRLYKQFPPTPSRDQQIMEMLDERDCVEWILTETYAGDEDREE